MVGRPLAGFGSSPEQQKGHAQPSAEQLRAVMQVNAVGPMFVAREALPHMLLRGEGLLVTVGSVMGLFGAAGLADYCASKHALVGLHEALRMELWRYAAPPSVRTMLVCPYHIADTSMFGDNLFNDVTPTQLARYSLPLRIALRVASIARSWIFPPLQSNVLARTIVHNCGLPAERTPPVLVVPWFLGALSQFLRGWLPTAWNDTVLGLFGGWHGMDGRTPEATHVS